ncbi:MAG TPA: TonB-dependent receptor, partial [bacterium]|nr:TonB-dependent receptor [bacterium]
KLFGDKGSVIGNSDLTPEKGRNRDAGLVLDLSRAIGLPGMLELSAFRNVSDNMIVFVQNSQKTSQPRNIGRALVRGVESTLSFSPSARWNLSANFTYQNARDDSLIPFRRGNFLPGRHEREIGLRAEYKIHEWKMWCDSSHSSGSFLDSANIYPVPERNVANAGVTFTGGGTTVTVEGKNLSDNRVSDIMGFPLPGRSFYLTVTKNLNK